MAYLGYKRIFSVFRSDVFIQIFDLCRIKGQRSFYMRYSSSRTFGAKYRLRYSCKRNYVVRPRGLSRNGVEED